MRKHAISAISKPLIVMYMHDDSVISGPLVMYMHDDSRVIADGVDPPYLSEFLCHLECTLYPSIAPTGTRTERKI